MLITIVPISKNVSLSLYGYNKKGELVFRSNRNIKHLQSEIIVIKQGTVYTNLYYFPEVFLKNLPKEPIDNQ